MARRRTDESELADVLSRRSTRATRICSRRSTRTRRRRTRSSRRPNARLAHLERSRHEQRRNGVPGRSARARGRRVPADAPRRVAGHGAARSALQRRSATADPGRVRRDDRRDLHDLQRVDGGHVTDVPDTAQQGAMTNVPAACTPDRPASRRRRRPPSRRPAARAVFSRHPIQLSRFLEEVWAGRNPQPHAPHADGARDPGGRCTQLGFERDSGIRDSISPTRDLDQRRSRRAAPSRSRSRGRGRTRR